MLIAFSITPLGTASASVSAEVAEAVRVVRASGLPHHTDAMFTTIEGEWDEVMAVFHDAVMAVAAMSDRVSFVLKGDYRPGHDAGAMEAKMRSVEAHLAAREAASD
ncbi:MAG: MTH1187 family thiamine-binding protein [Dehalococcoidia bacterium]|nr:MTH1187 family thiamine-binding protein [Dehalococcoidia bacterium]